MSIKQRAVNDDQRRERRQVLLDAAWQLFKNKPYEQINIVDVARAAKLAKGTVYLYFNTKEALFLAVQEQQLIEWFDALEGELAALAGCDNVFDVASVICGTLGSRPALTRLFSILHVVLEQNIDYPTALVLKQMLLARITRLGEKMETCLPVLQPGQGAQSAMWIYTFLLGLHQLTNPAPVVREVIKNEPGMELFSFDFCHECKTFIITILTGMTKQRE